MNNKKVFIVKINDMNSDIYGNVKKSYEQIDKKDTFYNTAGENEDFLRNNGCVGDTGIVMFISYKQENENEIQDMYIGEAEINEQWNIKYKIYRHLEKDDIHAIKSIIDKVDLDINVDFAPKTYIVISEMQSLYEELRQRIYSTFRKNNSNRTNIVVQLSRQKSKISIMN